MGTVYAAEDDGRPIAIKVLNGVQEHNVYRLKTEFRMLRERHHPNVLSVYELFQEEGIWFFSMERVDGMPMHRYLEARRLRDVDGPASAHLALLRRLFFQLFEGVAAIHAAGLVHRDLKPTNVLVTRDERLVIVDFGLVSEQTPGGIGQTIDNRVSGTFGYMSPEQARGAPATAASDCYSLGAMLRQLLPLGRRGFLGGAASALAEAAVTDVEFEDAASLVTLCARLTTPLETQRPTAQELLSLCAGWAAQPVVDSKPATAQTCVRRFVGRERELSQLADAYRRTGSNGTVLAIVRGPCGIGKSRLVREFLDEHIDMGTVVLEGRCSEWESVSYNGLDGIMDRLSRMLLRLSPEDVSFLVPRHTPAVIRLFPTLRRVPAFLQAEERAKCENLDTLTLRRQAITGLKDLFFRLTEQRRVVIVIEDLQWADANTLQILADLANPPDDLPLMMVLTVRAEEEFARDLLGDTAVDAHAVDLELGPLLSEESRALASALLPRATDASQIERVVAESDGIPEYIIEFTHELRIAPADCELICLNHALMARIERLSVDSRNLLDLLTIAMRPITLGIARQCGLSELNESLRQLMNEHLVRSAATPDGSRAFTTYTEYVRKVVMHAFPEERAAIYHARLASALEAVPDVEPEWLLIHYRLSGSHVRAKEYSIIIAEKALGLLAYDHAAAMFQAALEMSNEQSSDWLSLNVRCAEALTNAGRAAEAARAFVRAARAESAEGALALLNLAVEQWIRSGHLEEGVQLLRQTLTAADVPWPETEAAAILQLISRRISTRLRGLDCDLRSESEVPPALLRQLDALRPAQTVLGAFDYLRGAAFAALALPLALKAREPRRLLVALATEAIFAAMLGGTAGTKRFEVVRSHMTGLAKHAQSLNEHAAPSMVQAVGAYWMGDWQQVSNHASKTEQLLRCNTASTSWEATLVRSIRHTVLLHAGEFEALARDLPDALSRAVSCDDRYAYLDLLRRKASLCLMQDDVTEAANVLQEIHKLRLRCQFVAFDHLIMSLVVSVHLYADDVAGAQAELASRWKTCRRMSMHRFPLVRLTVIGMQADCLLADCTASATARANSLRKLATEADAVPVAWATALGYDLRAMAYSLVGRTGPASQTYAHAARSYERCGLLVCQSVAQFREIAATETDEHNHPHACSFALLAKPLRWHRIAHSLY